MAKLCLANFWAFDMQFALIFILLASASTLYSGILMELSFVVFVSCIVLTLLVTGDRNGRD